MAKRKKPTEKKQPITYSIILPEGVNVIGYTNINLCGRSQAVSCRDAVSNLIARRERELRQKGYSVEEHFIGKVMSALDSQFGGAERHAFANPEIKPPFVEQSPEELKHGARMSLYEKLIIRDNAFAHDLALKDNADVRNPRIQMKYLDIARYLISETNKIR